MNRLTVIALFGSLVLLERACELALKAVAMLTGPEMTQ